SIASIVGSKQRIGGSAPSLRKICASLTHAKRSQRQEEHQCFNEVSSGGLDESILLIKSCQQFSHYPCYNLHDEIFQKFNFDTKWAVRLISKITNDEDIPIKGDAIVKQ
ncbi:hypothetical protein S83_070574, partial [Arachis hypogaea]